MLAERVKWIGERMRASKRPLIVISKPVDPDCVGSAIILHWWMRSLSSAKTPNPTIVSFHAFDRFVRDVPGSEAIDFRDVDHFDFSSYDLFVLVDGGDWSQFFSSSWENVLMGIERERIVHIDHHRKGSVGELLGRSSLRVMDSCTAKVVYDYFVRPSGVEPTKEVATCLYKALVSDTGNFRHQIYDGTFLFANELLRMGADHEKAVQVHLSRGVVECTMWAMANTQYYPRSRSTVLVVDAEMRQFLQGKYGQGDDAPNTLHRYYKSIFMSLVEGYPYSLLFESVPQGGIRVSWRTKTASPIAVQVVLEELGFAAGGHRNAGGGFVANNKIDEVASAFLKAMELRLARLASDSQKSPPTKKSPSKGAT